MTAPNQPTPDGSIELGAFRALQTATPEDVQASLKAGAKLSFTKAQGDHKSEVLTPISERPKFTQTPVNSALWTTMDPREHATVPRTQLIHGTASGTASGGSGDSSHSHNLNRIPDYQPAGNNADWAEIGFIRVQRDADLRYVGFMTGDAQTFFGINAAYLGVYSVDTETGLLTLLTPTLAATNIKSLVTDINTETRFDMGLTIEAEQDQVFAVALLQDTSSIQTAASLMCVRITDLNRFEGTKYPRRPYCYAGPSPLSALPQTITAANQHWDSSTKLPFFYLREV
ncbi:hypothetical protein IU443_29310 [Nocardia farcinica]|uniref:Uncharacterized protein n=1 Tax=Nocardia farcinica TaxID=37329 RepID=A0A0H5P9K2_NOCFR|nr:hypothetical protein [Nocardia farcinica]MBF6394032.1 hypothetical protein [Nocardia farcinica]PFW98730.1 hypothetical protein CJ469_05983 [Nocardia farcinica]PFX04318.1 hypothetical protein CJ468_05564 [Nocardia farcinica]CRY84397.1 Uncharacterised protein [Nocardia farcinica]SIT34323.1 hypothetical protein SAMN05421776_12341 [Nocardia farcinica]